MYSQRSVITGNGSLAPIHSYPRPPNRLPVDDEGYLEPSPKSPPGPNKENHTPTGNPQYMDLLSDPVSQQGKLEFNIQPNMALINFLGNLKSLLMPSSPLSLC